MTDTLDALIAEMRAEADKDWHTGHDDVEDGVWSYQHEANGRAVATRKWADRLAALRAALAAPTLAEVFMETVPQNDLPDAAAKVLRENLTDLYTLAPATPAPAEMAFRAGEAPSRMPGSVYEAFGHHPHCAKWTESETGYYLTSARNCTCSNDKPRS